MLLTVFPMKLYVPFYSRRSNWMFHCMIRLILYWHCVNEKAIWVYAFWPPFKWRLNTAGNWWKDNRNTQQPDEKKVCVFLSLYLSLCDCYLDERWFDCCWSASGRDPCADSQMVMECLGIKNVVLSFSVFIKRYDRDTYECNHFYPSRWTKQPREWTKRPANATQINLSTNNRNECEARESRWWPHF